MVMPELSSPPQPEIHLPPFDDPPDSGVHKDIMLQPAPEQQLDAPVLPAPDPENGAAVPLMTSAESPDRRWQEFLAIQQNQGVTQVKAEEVSEVPSPGGTARKPIPGTRSSAKWPDWMRPLREPYVDRRKNRNAK